MGYTMCILYGMECRSNLLDNFDVVDVMMIVGSSDFRVSPCVYVSACFDVMMIVGSSGIG